MIILRQIISHFGSLLILHKHSTAGDTKLNNYKNASTEDDAIAKRYNNLNNFRDKQRESERARRREGEREVLLHTKTDTDRKINNLLQPSYGF